MARRPVILGWMAQRGDGMELQLQSERVRYRGADACIMSLAAGYLCGTMPRAIPAAYHMSQRCGEYQSPRKHTADREPAQSS